MSSHCFSVNQLSMFAASVYRSLGLSPDDAACIADTLVQADLWGHQSHGVMRTFWYGTRIETGATNVEAVPETVVDAGAVAVIDGHDGSGQIVAKRAMREAIDRAKRHGIGAVAVRNSGHFGTAMYFTRMAAVEGCIGILSTNASPAMAPWGGREKMVGTNPWSVAAPAGVYAPLMLDIANTAVARGKLYLAKQRNEPIPKTWATDEQGRPTTDAALGIAGNILPLAGHKGYAISTMMDVLSGILSASHFGNAVVGPYEPEGRSGVGHLAIALNIEAFRPLDEFNRDVEHLIQSLKASKKAPGVDEIFYPGELEERSNIENRVSGIVIPDDTLTLLNAEADRLNVPRLGALG